MGGSLSPSSCCRREGTGQKSGQVGGGSPEPSPSLPHFGPTSALLPREISPDAAEVPRPALAEGAPPRGQPPPGAPRASWQGQVLWPLEGPGAAEAATLMGQQKVTSLV